MNGTSLTQAPRSDLRSEFRSSLLHAAKDLQSVPTPLARSALAGHAIATSTSTEPASFSAAETQVQPHLPPQHHHSSFNTLGQATGGTNKMPVSSISAMTNSKSLLIAPTQPVAPSKFKAFIQKNMSLILLIAAGVLILGGVIAVYIIKAAKKRKMMKQMLEDREREAEELSRSDTTYGGDSDPLHVGGHNRVDDQMALSPALKAMKLGESEYEREVAERNDGVRQHANSHASQSAPFLSRAHQQRQTFTSGLDLQAREVQDSARATQNQLQAMMESQYGRQGRGQSQSQTVMQTQAQAHGKNSLAQTQTHMQAQAESLHAQAAQQAAMERHLKAQKDALVRQQAEFQMLQQQRQILEERARNQAVVPERPRSGVGAGSEVEIRVAKGGVGEQTGVREDEQQAHTRQSLRTTVNTESNDRETNIGTPTLRDVHRSISGQMLSADHGRDVPSRSNQLRAEHVVQNALYDGIQQDDDDQYDEAEYNTTSERLSSKIVGGPPPQRTVSTDRPNMIDDDAHAQPSGGLQSDEVEVETVHGDSAHDAEDNEEDQEFDEDNDQEQLLAAERAAEMYLLASKVQAQKGRK